MNAQTKKLLIAAAALLVLIGIFAGVWFATRPAAQEGAETVGTKTFTVEVVHADGSSKRFTYHTDEEYLGTVLQAEGLVEGEMGNFGLYIKAVDGETADFETDGAYWALYQGEDYAAQGVDATPIQDGDVFSLVYTVG